MTQELENNSSETNILPEPSPELSQPSNTPFIPRMGLKEITQTWEMLVKFRRAIEDKFGAELEAIAMGLAMVKQMEAQYRVQVDVATEAKKRAKEAVKNAGGSINGEKSPSPISAS